MCEAGRIYSLSEGTIKPLSHEVHFVLLKLQAVPISRRYERETALSAASDYNTSYTISMVAPVTLLFHRCC